MKKCQKCGIEKENLKEKFGISFCDICFIFAPNGVLEINNYVKEKININNINISKEQLLKSNLKNKKLMRKKARDGKIMSRAPFGYEIKNKKLIPNSFFREVEKIYKDFLNLNISLNKLSKKYNLSINGLKKVLTNFTYIGKIKFDGEVYNGNHEILISPMLFNHVQNKIEKLGIKRI